MPGILIAIDGPAGSGKSTVSKAVARKLGIGYLDTGAMYRALTWLCLEQDIPFSDTAAVRAAADAMELELDSDPADPHVFVDGTEVTGEIRSKRIAEKVSKVATNLLVREWMASQQRRLLLQARENGTGMVAEGRDITTVVCPEADVRVLLLADEASRLRRRTRELYGEISKETLALTEKQIGDRDRADSTVSQFFEPAEGVVVIDSSDRTVGQVVDEVINLADKVK